MSVPLGLHRMVLPLSFGVMCAKLAAAVAAALALPRGCAA
jgi:hypothetical protein